ncbi:MAG: HIT family protein [Pseudomonadota bacterium]
MKHDHGVGESRRTGEIYDPNCPFCQRIVLNQIEAEYGTAAALKDLNPVTPGHHLVIPKSHARDFFDLSDRERLDADRLLIILSREITANDGTVSGFNIGWNCGVSAGQTLFHAHCHLIPRRTNDHPHPRGGVRGVIPEKMSY